MAKEYPIQNVSFRGETDNFLTEAGGDSRVPKWVNDATISANGGKSLWSIGVVLRIIL